MRTRYAPTPSGYLHRGNAAHLLLVAYLAAQSDAEVVLRIDDADAGRCRPEYLQDIFDVLTWLDLSWNVGPRSAAEMSDWTQTSRLHHYKQARHALVETGQAYACTCTRSDWQGYEGNECPGNCRERRVVQVPGETALRLHLAGVCDPIIWRRDDIPAYHLTSVVDDDLFAVDLVVRGEDLRDSTHVQCELSRLLPNSSFHTAQVIHHPLISDPSGVKLSKSAGSQAQAIERTDEVRRQIAVLADELAAGITPAQPRSRGN